MSDDITTKEINFDKFVKDIEKRENQTNNNFSSEEAKNFYELKRKRDELYKERWQNSIVWSEK